MVKTPSKTHDDLQEICIALLRLEESAGKKRVEIAKELGTNPSSLTKWLDFRQKISSTYVTRILNVYGGGMDAQTISRLIKVFSSKPEILDKLLKIEESTDETVIDKVEKEITFWADRLKK